MSEVETLFATLRQSNAVGLGIFEMSWNVIRPSCADVLSANKSLKTVDRAQYNCPFCAAGYETTLDNEVRVDPELGLVRLNRFVGAYDAGRIINPKTARSQAIGGIIWGVGQPLLEQSETDPASGQFVNRNYSGYLVATNAGILELDVLFVGGFDEEASPLGPRVLAS